MDFFLKLALNGINYLVHELDINDIIGMLMTPLPP
jgi:hypothetical protein